MSIKTLGAALAAIFFLAGCATHVPLTNAQVGRISADTPAADLNAILGKATVAAKYDVDADGQTYHVRRLALKTGTRMKKVTICTKTCNLVNIPVAVTTHYLLIQEMPSQKLLGWGTTEELSKNPDERIASIMPKLRQVDAAAVQPALPR
jgi:outer membrane murein-binding lipoprotein Lpp